MFRQDFIKNYYYSIFFKGRNKTVENEISILGYYLVLVINDIKYYNKRLLIFSLTVLFLSKGI